MNNTNSFTLKATNAAFSQRQKNVFDQLNALENNRRNVDTHNDEYRETNQPPEVRTKRAFTKHFRGKESIFKQPLDRAPKNFIRTIPDFKKNPHKWTKYTLSDVRDEDISETSNTKAALAFLNDLKQRKELEEKTVSDSFSKKVVFNRPVANKKELTEDSDSKPSFRSSKVVMPEYVVGQKKKREKNFVNESIKQGKKQELKLDHLLENEDE